MKKELEYIFSILKNGTAEEGKLIFALIITPSFGLNRGSVYETAEGRDKLSGRWSQLKFLQFS